MKTNAVTHCILPSAILIILLLSNLSLTARNKSLPYSAADTIQPALLTVKTALSADLNRRQAMISLLKQKMPSHSNYQTNLRKELIERMDVMNPGNGKPSNEYEILNFK